MAESAEDLAAKTDFKNAQFAKTEVADKVVAQYDDGPTMVFYQITMGAPFTSDWSAPCAEPHAQGGSLKSSSCMCPIADIQAVAGMTFTMEYFASRPTCSRRAAATQRSFLAAAWSGPGRCVRLLLDSLGMAYSP